MEVYESFQLLLPLLAGRDIPNLLYRTPAEPIMFFCSINSNPALLASKYQKLLPVYLLIGMSAAGGHFMPLTFHAQTTERTKTWFRC